MGRSRWRSLHLKSIAISAVLACVPLGNGALGAEFSKRQYEKATVTDVRVGKHSDRTRVVLDISRPAGLRYDVSAGGNAVFIDLPGVKWAASPFEPRHSKGRVLEFRYAPTQEGGRFNILTDGPVTVNKPFLVKPSGARGHRIVLDLMPSNILPSRKSFSPHRGLLRASYSDMQPTPNKGSLVAGLNDVGVTGEDPPEILADFSSRANIRYKNKERPGRLTVSKVQNSVMQTQNAGPYYSQKQTNQHPADLKHQKLYLKALTGLTLVPEITNSGGGNENTMEFDPGFGIAGGIGIDLQNNFRSELEISYSTNTLDQLQGTANGQTVGVTTFGDNDMATLAFMGNVAYDFPSQGQFIPYVSGGAGLTGVFMNEVKANDLVISDSADWVFAMQFGAGVSMPIDDITTLEAGYRYFESSDPEFGDQRGVPFTMQLSSHSFMLGARLTF